MGGDVARLATGLVDVISAIVCIYQLGNDRAGVAADIDADGSRVAELTAAQQGNAIALVQIDSQAMGCQHRAGDHRYRHDVGHGGNHGRCTATTAAAGHCRNAESTAQCAEQPQAGTGIGRNIRNGAALDAAQCAVQCPVALRHAQQHVMAAMRIHGSGVVTQCDARCAVPADHIAAGILAGQGDAACRRGIAFEVEVLQRDLGAIGVLEVKVVPPACGNDVVQQRLFVFFAFDQAVMLARLHLDGIGLPGLDRVRGLAGLQGQRAGGCGGHGSPLCIKVLKRRWGCVNVHSSLRQRS